MSWTRYDERQPPSPSSPVSHQPTFSVRIPTRRPTDSREHQQRRNIVRREYSLEGDRLSGTSLVAGDAAAAEIDAFGRRAG